MSICEGQTVNTSVRFIYPDSVNYYPRGKSFTVRLNKNGKLIHRLSYEKDYHPVDDWHDDAESAQLDSYNNNFGFRRLYQLNAGK
jgi:hypothetical protein